MAMRSDPKRPADGNTPAAVGDRLDSWKAIAAYLNRDVSTVRRWEKHEGLPAHRHVHHKLGSIFAYRSEIDDWWARRCEAGAVDLPRPGTGRRPGENGEFAVLDQDGGPAPAEVPAALHANRSEPRPRWAAGRPTRLVLVTLLASLALSGLWYARSLGTGGSASPFRVASIAVIPFENDSGNPDDEPLVDGLTEGIINGLSSLPDLTVISRASVFRYKGRDIVPRDVGRELGGVQALLLGRIARRQDRLVLTLELVDARDDRQLWGFKYERGVPDTGPPLHEAVVRDVVRAVTGRESGARTSWYTRNRDVYDLYLLGRYHWNKRTSEGFQRAIAAFSHAIEKDPSYAPAYAGLADSYALMGHFAYLIPFDEARSKARGAAVKALALDDSLAEAHTSMASVLEFEWNWAGAEREYRRAIELAPSYATAHHWYANNLSLRGRHDEAVAHARRAVELDPLSPILRVASGHAYLQARRYDDAVLQLQRALAIEPGSANAHLFLGVAYQRKGLYAEALGEMLEADRLFENWLWKAILADLYVKMNRPEQARAIARAFNSRRSSLPASRVAAAAMHAALGERDRALALLEEACDARDPDIDFIKSAPPFDALQGDPAFQALLRRIGLG